MERVRCQCPRDSLGALCGRDPRCAIHGTSGADPAVAYRLSHADRQLLKSFRIATVDDAALSELRTADEQRFNPPRQA
jgi:hypothetical protein